MNGLPRAMHVLRPFSPEFKTGIEMSDDALCVSPDLLQSNRVAALDHNAMWTTY
jgi:hypothetical protein